MSTTFTITNKTAKDIIDNNRIFVNHMVKKYSNSLISRQDLILIVHEALVTAYNIEQEESKYHKLAYTIAKNNILNEQRNRFLHTNSARSDNYNLNDYHDDVVSIEDTIDCQNQLDKLNEEDRELIYKYYIEGLTALEIAKQTGYARSAVSFRVRQAVEWLSENLNDSHSYKEPIRKFKRKKEAIKGFVSTVPGDGKGGTRIRYNKVEEAYKARKKYNNNK